MSLSLNVLMSIGMGLSSITQQTTNRQGDGMSSQRATRFREESKLTYEGIKFLDGYDISKQD